MTITTRHYNDIAAAIHHGYDNHRDRMRAVDVLLPAMAAGNSQFDPDRFRGYVEHGYDARYVVTTNVTGYLPWSDPSYFATLSAARAYAAELATEYRDQYGYAAVRGSARDGWYDVDDGAAGFAISVVDIRGGW
jgi:hypothetical protein